MTILEALNWGKEQLKKDSEGTVSPMLDAQILLAHCVLKPTSFLFGHFEDELNSQVVDKYQRFIERRKRKEPVSQILGEKHFFGKPFLVSPNVLTPRPETERLIEIALDLITPESIVIDVGTGSGAIGITIAMEAKIPIIATDIDPQAISVATHNAKNHNVEHLISFLQGNLLEPYFAKNIHINSNSNAIILANLPYLSINQWMTLDPDVRDYEPKRALVGGVDGLDYYDELLQQIKSHRAFFPSELYLIIEIDPSHHASAPALIMEHFPKTEVRVEDDLSARARVVITKL
ncbi:peptide chain release factor N(5)-glutamine methyltransferase [Candidatus Uhrbacteria bacterium CG_4_9_14_0_2_um_filter_41_50]|uniref:Peptide chain release factor N(5)-glutamine methyltransferase n=1 Tax=Candidatus Uhrbacteria bacterium CG_4_9_14_0_2_um_filter_41_50 TaxID=1975031 RepID=A0A2M8ENM0_9BACT|nr:MAG: peptide chain release factor N(5)-glutamine methyltransferase [Candidatus Uhrbacteria bacterium CG_4_10_14_3_um_filter_41_21]PIZ54245.1 MAG: peptide chain release factor N(5)-glutamine methyltransferase [Candidatus Uhrbacteria bacterium CG_4_10_14_0_2_um_filter_41_21]PJB84415.1 MAG: peptide chain release factor N(5)-glutamine methyltransferase [Candidatus Uhrbacteria bacterium CG_4_9_14_0_8_um_filter_41_16]PJC24352.1 MAG: peptide chain release factor N(5)-glutamine methyltransferase [Can